MHQSRAWHLNLDQVEEYVASIHAPAARRVVEPAEGWQHEVTERGEIEALISRGDGQGTSIHSFGKKPIEIGMSGWGESPFEAERGSYGFPEVDTSDPDSTLRVYATVKSDDGFET